MKTANEFLKAKGIKDTLYDVNNPTPDQWINGGLSALLDEYATQSQTEQGVKKTEKNQYGYPCVIDNELVFVVAKNIADCLDKLKVIANGKPHHIERNSSHRILLQSDTQSEYTCTICGNSHEAERTDADSVQIHCDCKGRDTLHTIKPEYQSEAQGGEVKYGEDIECECGHTVPDQFATMNDDGQWTCYKCVVEILSETLKESESYFELFHNSSIRAHEVYRQYHSDYPANRIQNSATVINFICDKLQSALEEREKEIKYHTEVLNADVIERLDGDKDYIIDFLIESGRTTIDGRNTIFNTENVNLLVEYNQFLKDFRTSQSAKKGKGE